MERKAQGEIITTILIILLVLAAIVIVWQAVRGTIGGGVGKIEAGAACIGLDVSIDKVVCDTNSTGGNLSVTLSRGGDNVLGNNLTVTATNVSGTLRQFGSLDPLGTVTIVLADRSSLMAGATETSINTGLTTADGKSMCQGSKATFKCT